jgi:hypothetical protein
MDTKISVLLSFMFVNKKGFIFFMMAIPFVVYLQSDGLRHGENGSVERWLLTNVSGQPVGSICKGQEVLLGPRRWDR